MSNNNKFIKQCFSFKILLVLLCLSGCRGDGETDLVNGYKIVFVSSENVFIVDKNKVILDAKVENYRVEGNNILVAKRPIQFVDNDGLVLSKPVYSYICEYWIIDTKKNTLLKTSNIKDLDC